jgi:hypothetical protein
MVKTEGYAKVDCQLEKYRIEAVSGSQVLGVVYSWDDPVGGSAGQAALAMALADTNNDGIPDAPTDDQDVFNNICFEQRVIGDLARGRVRLAAGVGSVTPRNGTAMFCLDGHTDAAGLTTKLMLPVDADKMYLDYVFLASQDAGIPSDAFLAMAIYDSLGHISWAELVPGEMQYSAMGTPADGYGFSTPWSTAAFDLTGMEGEVYFAAVFNTEAVSGMDLGVGLDNLRTFGEVPEPASLALLFAGGLVLLKRRHIR